MDQLSQQNHKQHRIQVCKFQWEEMFRVLRWEGLQLIDVSSKKKLGAVSALDEKEINTDGVSLLPSTPKPTNYSTWKNSTFMQN